MKTASQHRAEIRSIIEANRRKYVAARITDLSLPAMHPDALEVVEPHCKGTDDSDCEATEDLNDDGLCGSCSGDDKREAAAERREWARSR